MIPKLFEKIYRRLVVDIVYSISQWVVDSAFLPSSLGKNLGTRTFINSINFHHVNFD